MGKLRYYALRDELGFPIPGTLRGYKKDPCKCELVEIVGNPDTSNAEFRHYHPNGVHYFYQVTGTCCDVVPNSLIATSKRPRGKYREFFNIPNIFTQIVTDTFFADDCVPGQSDTTGTEYSKTYKALTQEELDAKVTADAANFVIEGQDAANDAGNCEPD